MNNKGNLMLNLLFFLMALGVLVILVSPMVSFIDIAQGSNFLNCQGYVDENANTLRNYSYNSSQNTSSLACLSISLYLPYIFLVFLIAGVSRLLYERGTDFFVSGGQGG